MQWRKIYSILGVNYSAGPARIATSFGVTEYGVYNSTTHRVSINTSNRPKYGLPRSGHEIITGTVFDTALHELGHWTMRDILPRDLNHPKEELFACEFALAMTEILGKGNQELHARMAAHYCLTIGRGSNKITKRAWDTAKKVGGML